LHFKTLIELFRIYSWYSSLVLSMILRSLSPFSNNSCVEFRIETFDSAWSFVISVCQFYLNIFPAPNSFKIDYRADKTCLPWIEKWLIQLISGKGKSLASGEFSGPAYNQLIFSLSYSVRFLSFKWPFWNSFIKLAVRIFLLWEDELNCCRWLLGYFLFSLLNFCWLDFWNGFLLKLFRLRESVKFEVWSLSLIQCDRYYMFHFSFVLG